MGTAVKAPVYKSKNQKDTGLIPGHRPTASNLQDNSKSYNNYLLGKIVVKTLVQ